MDIIPRLLSLVDSYSGVTTLSLNSVYLSPGLCFVFANFIDQWDRVTGSH